MAVEGASRLHLDIDEFYDSQLAEGLVGALHSSSIVVMAWLDVTFLFQSAGTQIMVLAIDYHGVLVADSVLMRGHSRGIGRIVIRHEYHIAYFIRLMREHLSRLSLASIARDWLHLHVQGNLLAALHCISGKSHVVLVEIVIAIVAQLGSDGRSHIVEFIAVK